MVTVFTAGIVLLLGIGGAGLASAWAGTTNPPNIIFILADDMGWGDLGVFYQNSRNFAQNRNRPAFVTPKLDTMAAEGLQLRRHYCPAPVCAPSRASLLLGVHQGHANVRDNQFDKALENNHTLASVLRQAGYATAAFGKWGLQGSGVIPVAHPQYRGFDYFFGYMTHANGHHHYPKENGQPVWDGFSTNLTSQLDKCYTIDLWTARAKKWISDQRATHAAQPFFIYLAYDAPHAQLQVPSTAYPAGGGANGGVQWTGTPGAMLNTSVGAVDTFIHPDYTNATWDSDNNASTAEVAWPTAEKRHATMMRRLDDAVGDLLQLLKDLGIDDNTLVVFTSDNGPHNEAGSGGSYTQDPTFFDSFGPMDGIKRDSWEGGMREPTLARWPGHIPTGGISTAASQFHDWLPTFAELAGLPGPARSDGVSLVPTLTGAGAQRPSTIYVEYYYSGTTPKYAEFEAARQGATRKQEQVVHVDGYKGIRYNITSATNDFRIYDTLNDPKETTDRAGTSPYFVALQQRMKERVLQLRRPLADAARPFDAEPVPPDSVSNLVAGVDFRAFEGSFPWVPDFTPLSAAATGSCSGLDLSVRTRTDNVGLLYTGYLQVPADGTYTFYLATDGRAFLRLHEASLLDADFGYSSGSEVSASINLKAGRHAFRLGYIRGTGGSPSLALQWSGPGLAKQPVAAANLLHVGTGSSFPPAAYDDSAATPRGQPVMLDVLANDAGGSGPGPLAVVSVGVPKAGAAVTNGAGEIVYTPNSNFLGEDAFTYTMTDGFSQATATARIKVYFRDGSLWFPFNQASGLTTEEAGGAGTAALVGYPDDTSPWAAGKWNQALQFDGVANQAVVTGFKGILGASNRTVAAWLKTTNTGSFLCWGVKSTGQKWLLRVQNENGTAGALRVEVEGGYIVGSRDLRDGQWHHVAAVFTNNVANVTNIALYVDGARQSVSAQSAQVVNTVAGTDVQLGTDIQARYFSGALDEVRLFERALSAAEVAALATATNQSAAAWHRRYYGEAPVDWSGPDSLGAPRLLDYALGGEPWTAERSRLELQARVADHHLQVLFPRRLAGTSELVYLPEVSSNLLTWDGLAVSLVSAIPLAELPGFEQAVFQADAPLEQQAALYMRLKVGF